MALFDAPDEQLADSSTAADILKRKFPGLLPDAPSNGNTIPLFNSVTPQAGQRPTLGVNTPDVTRPSPTGAANDPYTPQDLIPRQSAAPTPPPRSPNSYLPWSQEYRDYQKGLTKAQKLGTILKSGLMGAMAGQAASEQAVIQSGGRRSAGFGTGAMAAIEQPIQQAAQQQAVQRSGLENQILGAQAQYAPQMQALNFGKTMADIQKNLADASKMTAEAGAVPIKSALENAQALAARYKEDPGSGQLIDLQTGQPYGSSTGLAPLSAEEAGVLGKQEGERVPIKLKNTASEIVNRGIKSVSAGGRQLLVDGQGNTIKDLGQATPMAVINAQQQPTPVTPEMKNAVDMVGNGKVDLATALAPFRRFPGASESFLSDLNARYPNYNQATYGVSKKTMEYFTTGKGAEELNAFRTAIAHADLLDQAATALQNKDRKAYNTVKNALKTQFGDPEPTNFNVISNAYTREVTKALSAGHITDSEVSTQGATMPQNAGPEQIHGATQAYKSLMSSKAQQRMIQYEQGLQGKPAFPDFGGAMPAGATMKVPGSDGKLHWSDGKKDLGVVQ